MIKDKYFDYGDALKSLRPGSNWSIIGDDYLSLTWADENSEPPSEEDLKNEIIRLEAEWQSKVYQRLRESEYPDFREYLDGIVKNDQAQINKYIADCIAIKEKYPEPK